MNPALKVLPTSAESVPYLNLLKKKKTFTEYGKQPYGPPDGITICMTRLLVQAR